MYKNLAKLPIHLMSILHDAERLGHIEPEGNLVYDHAE